MSTKNTLPLASQLLRYRREGFEQSFAFALSALPGSPSFNPLTRPTWTAGAPTSFAGFASALGRTTLVYRARIGGDQFCETFVQYLQSLFTGALAEARTRIGAIGQQGGESPFEFGDGGLILPENSSFNFGTNVPSGNNPFLFGDLAYLELTADHNYDAKFITLGIGTSITRFGVAGPVGTSGMKGNDCYLQLLHHKLRSRGLKVRHVNKGIAGLTIPQATIKLNDDVTYACIDERMKVRLIVDETGMNDDTVTTQQQVNTYLDTLVALRDEVYPNAQVLITGPSLSDVPSKIIGLPNVRTWKSAYVTAHPGKRLIYKDLSLAFSDVSVDCAESSVGTRIHWNIQGHLDEFNFLWPTVAAVYGVSP